tara:strand:- start:434 stop:913 length:480 start_codon:yes stop_codon:yes gene_type:complete
MAAPTPQHTASGSVNTRFFQQTSCSTADAWTTLIPQQTAPADLTSNYHAMNKKCLGYMSFHHTTTGEPIKFGIRVVNKLTGAVGDEFMLVYEDYVTSQEERMSDVDIIQGLDKKSCKVFDFSGFEYLQYDHTLEYYSSKTSGFLINCNLQVNKHNIKLY